jgi:hypothetical protein
LNQLRLPQKFFKIDTIIAVYGNALFFQQLPLYIATAECITAAKPARFIYDPMTWYDDGLLVDMQSPTDLPRHSRVTRKPRNLTVSGDLALGYPRNYLVNKPEKPLAGLFI